MRKIAVVVGLIALAPAPVLAETRSGADERRAQEGGDRSISIRDTSVVVQKQIGIVVNVCPSGPEATGTTACNASITSRSESIVIQRR